MLLYSHNQRALENVETALETSDRTYVSHPTGTGKSYIATAYIKAHRDKKILYVTSYLSNLKRFAEQLASALSTPTQATPALSTPEMKRVGQEETVGQEEKVVIDFTLYSALPGMYDRDVLLGRKDAARLKPLDTSYDVIILDEFHRAGANTWNETVKSLIEGKKVIGFSATPIRYLDDNRDMGKELFDGNCASEMSLYEALVKGLIPAPHYITAAYSLWTDFAKAEGELKKKWLTDREKKEAADVLLHARQYLEKAEGLDFLFETKMEKKTGKYIVFCSSVIHMAKMIKEDWFDWAPEVHRYIVHARVDQPMLALEQFEKDDTDCLRLLFCVDMLNEGVHLKGIDGVIMLRPTKSLNVYLQQLGRAIAVGERRTVQIFDIVNNANQLEPARQFWTGVINATRDKPEFNGTFDIFARDLEFYALMKKLKEYTEGASWETLYGIAKRFYEAHGHLRPPQKKLIEGYRLSNWLNTQRTAWKKGKLSLERIQLLNDIGMVWEFPDLWYDYYEALKEYKREKGNLFISDSWTTPEGLRLGAWSCRQRTDARKGTITPERKALLDQIGFPWDFREEKWRVGLEEYKKYIKETGKLKVPCTEYVTSSGLRLDSWDACIRRNKDTLPAEIKNELDELGYPWDAQAYLIKQKWLHQFEKEAKDKAWIEKQRRLKRLGQLEQWQIDALDSIGIVWEPRDGQEWYKKYEKAKNYYEAHGSLKGLCMYDISLYQWTLRNYKADLSEEREKLLKDIGVDRAIPLKTEIKMEEKIRILREYKGDLNVPVGFVSEDGYPIGKWVSDLRYRRDKDILVELGINPDGAEAKRLRIIKNGIAHLREYRNRFGNRRVLSHYRFEDGFNLYSFLNNRLPKYELTDEQKAELEELGVSITDKGVTSGPPRAKIPASSEK